MPLPLLAAGIIGGSSLLSAGMQAWFNSSAQDAALRESRRSEKLRIKFAKEETEREEKRFNRTFGFQQAGQNFNMNQQINQNLMTMFESNREASMRISNHRRSR